MKTIRRSLQIVLLACFVGHAPAIAAPAEGTVSRFGFEGTTWQESLAIQPQTGQAIQSVANYKGLLVSFERQWRFKTGEKTGGYALGILGGQGQASGGDSSNYKRGSASWTLYGLQPKILWALSESIDVSVSVAAIQRQAEWPNSSTANVSAARSLNAVFFAELDCAINERFGLRQSIGLTSQDIGPFLRWALTYDLNGPSSSAPATASEPPPTATSAPAPAPAPQPAKP